MGSTVPNFHRRVTQCQKEIFALNFDAIVHWRKLSAMETSQTAAGCIVNDSPFLSDECIWVYGLYLHGIPSVPEYYKSCTCMVYLLYQHDIPSSAYTLLIQAKAQVYLNFLSAPGCTWLHNWPKYGQLPLVTIPDVNFLNDSC